MPSDQPFLAAHDHGCTHQMVVNHVREMVGRDAVRFQDYDVLVVFGDFHFAFYEIVMAHLVFDAALRAEPHHVRRALFELSLDVLKRAVAPDGAFAVIAEILLVFLLLSVHGGKLFLGAEAGVSLSLLHQLFCEYLVDFRAQALTVGAVAPGLPVQRRALVEGQAERAERVQDRCNAPLDLALFVGVLNRSDTETKAIIFFVSFPLSPVLMISFAFIITLSANFFVYNSGFKSLTSVVLLIFSLFSIAVSPFFDNIKGTDEFFR